MTLFFQNSASSLRHSRVEVSDCSRVFGFFLRLKSSSSDDSPSPNSSLEAESFYWKLVTFYLYSGTKFPVISAGAWVSSCAQLAILAINQQIDLQGSHRLRFRCALQLSPLFLPGFWPLYAYVPSQNLQ